MSALDELARDLATAETDSWATMAANLLAAGYRKVDPEAETRTEWGLRRPPKYNDTYAGPMRRDEADSLAESWGKDNVVVSRTVTYGPWTEVEQ